MLYEKFSKWYGTHYKVLMIIPLIVFLLCSSIFINNKSKNGEFFPKDIDLSGGTLFNIYTSNIPLGARETIELANLNFREVKGHDSNEIIAVMVEAGPDYDETEVRELVESVFPDVEYDVRNVGPSMGESFMSSAQKAIIFAFIMMGLVLAFIFKQPIVALTVILSGFLNVFEAAAVMTLFGVKLAPHTIGALLMLMGWGVDSEVLFDTKLLREKGGEPKKRALTAMKTAMTMSFAVFASLSSLYFISTSTMIKDMALVLLLGAFFDIINTWFQSLSMVLWFMEAKQ